MSMQKECSATGKCGQCGNAVVGLLVVLVVIAVGVLAYMSGKMGNLSGKPTGSESSSVMASGENTDPKANPVIAKVDGEEIKRQEVVDLVNIMPPQMQQLPLEQLYPIAVEQLVNNKIIDSKLKGENLDNDPDVQKQLANAKEQIIRAKFVENAVEKEMTDERLKAKFETYVKNFPDVEEVKAAHILVDSEAKAKDLIKELDGGAKFADLATKNSKDATAKNGGELGYFTKQDVVAPFADAAFATKPGEYTKKPVKSDFGWHVIKVEEKRKRPPGEYEQVKPYLQQEARREILDEVVMKWREGAKIERFDINGNPLPEKQEPAAGEGAAKAPEAAPAEKAPEPKAEDAKPAE